MRRKWRWNEEEWEKTEEEGVGERHRERRVGHIFKDKGNPLSELGSQTRVSDGRRKGRKRQAGEITSESSFPVWYL